MMTSEERWAKQIVYFMCQASEYPTLNELVRDIRREAAEACAKYVQENYGQPDHIPPLKDRLIAMLEATR